MQQTLLILRYKDKIYFNSIHSNWHFLKVVKNIVDHFRYDFLGCEIGRKNEITGRELMKKIAKLVSPYGIGKWEMLKSVRQLGLLDEGMWCYDGGYIMMDLSQEEFGCNNIIINLRNRIIDDDELIYKMFKQHLKELRSKRR